MAIDLARERKLLEFDRLGKVKKKQSSGADVEEVLGQIIEEKISISGGYKKATLTDTLLVRIIFLPVELYHASIWWSKWILKYWIRKEEYDEEAKLYLIRKNLKISAEQFNVSSSLLEFIYLNFQTLEEPIVDDYLAHEIWKKPEFNRWKAAKEEEERAKLANSARFKQYRRYMKTQAGNTISFLDD
jgi:DnaJ family protein C protein 25